MIQECISFCFLYKINIHFFHDLIKKQHVEYPLSIFNFFISVDIKLFSIGLCELIINDYFVHQIFYFIEEALEILYLLHTKCTKVPVLYNFAA